MNFWTLCEFFDFTSTSGRAGWEIWSWRASGGKYDLHEVQVWQKLKIRADDTGSKLVSFIWIFIKNGSLWKSEETQNDYFYLQFIAMKYVESR